MKLELKILVIFLCAAANFSFLNSRDGMSDILFFPCNDNRGKRGIFSLALPQFQEAE